MKTTRQIRGLWLAVAVSTALMLSTAADETNAARYNRLGHRLMCSCGCHDLLLECKHNPADNWGSNLGRGPCEVSLRMRDELKAALQKGGTDDVILAGFVQKYGEDVLLVPMKYHAVTKAASKLDWLVTFAVVLAMTVVLMLLVRKWQSRRTIAKPVAELHGEDVDDLRRRVRWESEHDDYGRPLP